MIKVSDTQTPQDTRRVKLNCDLGEGYDDVDRKVMPFIDQANVACGGHSGDEDSMQRTVELALKRGASIGAHPSYPDKENFGRISIAYSENQLLDSLLEQIENLERICREQGASLAYIKAHGALYNDSTKNPALMHMLLKLAKSFQCGLMVQALPKLEELQATAEETGIALIKEGFADRAYTDEGFLVSRQNPGAVHENLDTIVQQAHSLAKSQAIPSITKKPLKLKVDSICVHGDNDKAIDALQRIYDALH